MTAAAYKRDEVSERDLALGHTISMKSFSRMANRVSVAGMTLITRRSV